MKSAERLLKLQELFASREFVDAESLTTMFAASESTIRRDLIRLEEQGVLKRVHGGAISIKAHDETLDFGRLAGSAPAAKARIGRAAANLLKDHQTVVLGTGSTVLEVGRCLLGRPLHLITNSIPVAELFWDSKSPEVTLTGGYLYPRTGAQLGPICEQMLDSIHADVAVLGIGGITAVGLTDSNTLIMGTVKKMMKRARKVIVVADATKFGRNGMVRIASLDEIDVLVSDGSLADEHKDMIAAHSVELILA